MQGQEPLSNEDGDGEMSDKDEKPRRTGRRRPKTVLSWMQARTEGPLSLLQKYVSEHTRVRVLTRNYRHVRGICSGFIVVYDKHFNLAMVDVDEAYQNPLPPPVLHTEKKRRKRNKKKQELKHDCGDVVKLRGTPTPENTTQVLTQLDGLMDGTSDSSSSDGCIGVESDHCHSDDSKIMDIPRTLHDGKQTAKSKEFAEDVQDSTLKEAQGDLCSRITKSRSSRTSQHTSSTSSRSSAVVIKKEKCSKHGSRFQRRNSETSSSRERHSDSRAHHSTYDRDTTSKRERTRADRDSACEHEWPQRHYSSSSHQSSDRNDTKGRRGSPRVGRDSSCERERSSRDCHSPSRGSSRRNETRNVFSSEHLISSKLRHSNRTDLDMKSHRSRKDRASQFGNEESGKQGRHVESHRIKCKSEKSPSAVEGDGSWADNKVESTTYQPVLKRHVKQLFIRGDNVVLITPVV